MSAMFKSFAIANYRLWFAVATVSNVGTWMQRTAQDWIVLTELTDQDPVAVGVTMALQFGPVLVIGPFAGLLVDRIRTSLKSLALGYGATDARLIEGRDVRVFRPVVHAALPRRRPSREDHEPDDEVHGESADRGWHGSRYSGGVLWPNRVDRQGT